jgi:hypothetical protein
VLLIGVRRLRREHRGAKPALDPRAGFVDIAPRRRERGAFKDGSLEAPEP